VSISENCISLSIREFFFFFFQSFIHSSPVRPSEMVAERGTRRSEEIETYLDLIGDDGTRTELCADLVCPDRIKVYETESVDVTVALDVLEIAQTGHITLIGVVLPIKLHGDWGVARHVCQLDRRMGTGRKRKV
jgi:hypothetical protein